ncbi:MAG TPA: hypothetical protein VIL21_04840, partial [Solirubrobacterales bacterium]
MAVLWPGGAMASGGAPASHLLVNLKPGASAQAVANDVGAGSDLGGTIPGIGVTRLSVPAGRASSVLGTLRSDP